MKTTFKQYLQEATMPPAESKEDLLASIHDGKFTKDGSHLDIDGSFSCKGDKLVSLVGCPRSIGSLNRKNENFICYNNLLKTLEGGPSVVNGDYFCGANMLVSLKGAPQTISGDFACQNNDLTSLEGCPSEVSKVFSCSNNKLTSLKDIHKHIHSIGWRANFKDNPIKSHILGLLKIKGLKVVELDNEKVEAIINKYLPEGDMFACQQELIDNGFEEFAQL